jgi:hypothetical protein
MSSIYYGVYLGTLLGLSAVLLMPGLPKARLKAALVSLAIGGAVTIGLVTPYALPYLATKQEVGSRSAEQVVMFSAKPFSYTLATNTNYLYGQRSMPYGRPERRLFPGILPMLLALVGLLLRQPSASSIAYLLGLVAAFEMSLGLYGYSYSFLYWHAPVFDALRAPARLGIFVLFFLAVLAAKGHAALESALPRAGRWILAAVISGVLMLEYWVAPLPLIPFPNTAPPLYAWLARQPRGVVAEFPMPLPTQTPGHDPIYAYFSTFHWLPTVNGYSGYYPPSYIRRLEQVRHMPDERAFASLRHDGVRYVVIHTSLYDPERAIEILIELSRTGQFSELGRFKDGGGEAVVYGMR